MKIKNSIVGLLVVSGLFVTADVFAGKKDNAGSKRYVAPVETSKGTRTEERAVAVAAQELGEAEPAQRNSIKQLAQTAEELKAKHAQLSKDLARTAQEMQAAVAAIEELSRKVTADALLEQERIKAEAISRSAVVAEATEAAVKHLQNLAQALNDAVKSPAVSDREVVAEAKAAQRETSATRDAVDELVEATDVEQPKTLSRQRSPQPAAAEETATF